MITISVAAPIGSLTLSLTLSLFLGDLATGLVLLLLLLVSKSRVPL